MWRLPPQKPTVVSMCSPGGLDTIKAKASSRWIAFSKLKPRPRRHRFPDQRQRARWRRRHHMGMTSSDVLDTGLALQLKRSVALLRELDALATPCANWLRAIRARNDRPLPCHPGEPITFGFKVAGGWRKPSATASGWNGWIRMSTWAGERHGHLYEHRSPNIACEILAGSRHRQHPGDPRSPYRLRPDPRPGGRLSRALLTEIRNLQRTDVLEVEENFAKARRAAPPCPQTQSDSQQAISGLPGCAQLHDCCPRRGIAWHERTSATAQRSE